MKLFNNGRTWVGMIEVPLADFYEAQKQCKLNALLVSRGFNPYQGYHTMFDYLRCTIICQER